MERDAPWNIFIPLLCCLGLEPASISRVSVDKLDRLFTRSLSRLSETPSLLDFHNTLGNDSVLQCVLHQHLNGSYWYSVVWNWLFKTHLTPSYRLFSTQDATLVCCFGAPSLRGIGRHPSMPSAWIGFMRSNLLTSTANSFTDVTVKSNRTGNIPRQLRGIGVTSLYAFDQSRFGVLHYSHRSPTHKYLRSSHFWSWHLQPHQWIRTIAKPFTVRLLPARGYDNIRQVTTNQQLLVALLSQSLHPWRQSLFEPTDAAPT